MPKIDSHNLNADWSQYERRPPWGYVTSAELAEVLGVHIQTISNWKLRGILPEPDRLKGNRNRYRISAIKSWLEARDESSVTWDWIRRYLPASVKNLEEAEYLVQYCYSIFEVERA